MQPSERIDQTLALAGLALIIVGCYLVLRPFLTGLLWAVILVVTLWPMNHALRRRVKPGLAALVMVTLISLLVLVPFAIVTEQVAANGPRAMVWLRRALDNVPDPPAWVAAIPLVGEQASAYWKSVAHDTAALMREIGRFVEPLQRLAIASGVNVVGALVQLSMSILIAYFLFRDGAAIARHIDVGMTRLAAERGRRLLTTATLTVRGVVLGILGTALAQGSLAAFGFWLASVPGWLMLGFATLVLSPVPIGPPIVWASAGIWLIQRGSVGWGLFVLAWGFFVVSTIDNVLKPLIISQGSHLPFILVLLGVLGGIAAFGLIGVFIGPVLLALGYALANEWSTVSGAALSRRSSE
ncbi:MAG: AI-2E family transporter [Betaproteobacteria bacterium]|jgi:predicted PurR-regulated permease PerM|nr:AI-2E family transporter [Betaproteobacteria bacterium]MDH5286366.1 AI-2E family transporter [Betaproteobacteria bacterium]